VITFLHPGLLLFLLLVPALALWKGRQGRAAALVFSHVGVARTAARLRRTRPGWWRTALRLLVVALLVVAMARPRLTQAGTEIEASGVDIILAVDVSTSMEALDFEIGGQATSRLDVVKRVVAKFTDERPNDRIGLVAFAGRPYLVSPLTLDHDWLRKRLESLHTGMIEDGTAIGSALASSVNRLRERDAKSRIVILLTDGMNNAGKVAPLTAAEAAATLGIKVYTIGAGTRGEAPVPVTDAFGRRTTMMAKVDIDEKTLAEMARMTGGKYFRATDTESLARIYAEINRMEKTTRTIRLYAHHQELVLWILLPVLGLFLLEQVLAFVRRPRLP